MKNIIKILKFEYLSCVKNKAFIIVTIFLMGVMLLSAFLPALVMGLLSEDEEDGESNEKPVIAISSEVYDKALIKSEFEPLFTESDIKITKESTDNLTKKVDSGDYEFAVKIDNELKFTYITANNSLFSEDYETISDAVKSMYTVKALDKYGISQTETDKLMNTKVTFETVTTGTDQSKNYLPVYLLMCVLFIAITTYGQLVAQSVVSEKNSRAMELLITCAKPTHLMFGKVIGSGLAGLTQLAVLLLTALVSFGTFSSGMIPDEISEYIQLPVSTVLFALLFFILGYFMFSFILGALASFASKSEDLNTLTSPVIIVLSAVYMIMVFMCTGDMVDSTFMAVLSYFPISAPMAMFVRSTMTDIAVWEIALSAVVQIITIYLLGMLAAAIYKIGVLMYGNPPKFGEIIKMLKMQRKANQK
ncbi:MAG: ABC transporter permease [Clostridia bacterium]|nr:ABC transporter permease [Clostridia bacterium]